VTSTSWRKLLRQLQFDCVSMALFLYTQHTLVLCLASQQLAAQQHSSTGAALVLALLARCCCWALAALVELSVLSILVKVAESDRGCRGVQ
jgi:hypothetical protein